MTLLLMVMGGLLLMMPGWFPRRRNRVPLRRFVRRVRVLLSAGAALLLAGLLLWALPLVLHLADVVGVPGFCDDAVHRLPLGGLEVALIAGGVAAVLVARAVVALVTARRWRSIARVDRDLGRHLDRRGYELVVVPSARPLATAVPGGRPQVVVSDELVALLSDIELQAVVRHELAHQRLRHGRDLLLAAAIERSLGWLPSVRRSVHCLRSALEEWADESSASGSATRTAALRSALSRLVEHPGTPTDRAGIERRLERLTTDRLRARRFGPTDLLPSAVSAGTFALVTVLFAVELVVAVTPCPV